MQINTSMGGSGSASAMFGAMGSKNMDEMDAKLSSEILKAKDSDGSGALSATELGTSAEKLAEYDTDGNGEISSTELQAGLKAKREQMQASMQNQMAQSGHMGMLQASMGQGAQGMGGMDMSKMDTQMSKSIIDEKDTNKDGVLSASELGVSADNLSAVDSDGDGSVSEAELTASLKSHREEMMAENGGVMPPPPGGAGAMGGGQGAPNLDNLISGLFGDTASTSSTSSSSDSTSSTAASSLSGSMADFMLRQKASSSYLNMDRLIGDLFGSGSDTQSLSLSA